MISGTIIGTVGDVNYPEYDGGPVIRGEDGSYDVEYVFAPEENQDDPAARWTVYRADLSEPGEWCKWKDVAETCGQDVNLYKAAFDEDRMYAGTEETIARDQDDNAMARAQAICDAAGHYGWENFDSYPLELTEREVYERYGQEAPIREDEES